MDRSMKINGLKQDHRKLSVYLDLFIPDDMDTLDGNYNDQRVITMQRMMLICFIFSEGDSRGWNKGLHSSYWIMVLHATRYVSIHVPLLTISGMYSIALDFGYQVLRHPVFSNSFW